MVETVISDYMSPRCDLDLKGSKPIFLHDSLAHDGASPYTILLRKVQQLRKSYFDYISPHCSLDLENSEPFFFFFFLFFFIQHSIS